MSRISRQAIGWTLATGLTIATGIAFFTAPDAPPQKPYTYGDLARDETARCIGNGGDGQWDASLRVSLKEFCAVAGVVAASNEHRRERRY